MPVKNSAASRIAKYTIQSVSGCLHWTASVSTQGGYPMLSDDNGKLNYAYRIAWELVHGPIPEGHDIHHVCRLRTCLNTDHMECLTKAEHASVHKAERAEFHAFLTPRIRNLTRVGCSASLIKIATGATLKFIKDLVRADKKFIAAGLSVAA